MVAPPILFRVLGLPLLGMVVLFSPTIAAPPLPDGAEQKLVPSTQKMAGFQKWLKNRKAALVAGGTVVRTSVGPIEYRAEGHGPVVICLQGGFGGYDQSMLMGRFLVKSGFTVIGVSRAGYLRTPITAGSSLEQQADAVVALMDALRIKQAHIFGFSAGTPIAFQVGVRHPERVYSVVLTGVGTPGGDAPYYQFLTLFLKEDYALDVLPYGLYLLTQTDARATAELMFAVDSELTGADAQRRLNFVLNNPQQRELLLDLAITLTPLSVRRDGTLNDIEGVDAPWEEFAAAGQLQNFSRPILIVDAINDGNGSYPQTVDIADQIPPAQLLSVKNSGHFIWLGEDTAQWQAKMVTFLKTNQPKNPTNFFWRGP